MPRKGSFPKKSKNRDYGFNPEKVFNIADEYDSMMLDSALKSQPFNAPTLPKTPKYELFDFPNDFDESFNLASREELTGYKMQNKQDRDIGGVDLIDEREMSKKRRKKRNKYVFERGQRLDSGEAPLGNKELYDDSFNRDMLGSTRSRTRRTDFDF